MGKKLFDFAIGNPPYQNNFEEDGNKTYAAPIYNDFMDGAFEVADKVELITPARFLFNAGSTPKAWNEKMLADPHFKVLHYEEDASKVFPNTDIKGGIAITYYDQDKKFGSIDIFIKYSELNSIITKVFPLNDSRNLMSMIYIQNKFNLKELLNDYPHYKSSIGSNGTDSRFEKNIFSKIPIFVDTPIPKSIKTLGVILNKRVWRYIPQKYVDIDHDNIDKFKVVLPVANGTGEFGQILSSPVVLKPLEAYTRSFVGIGAFSNEEEGFNALAYIKTKFCRAMLSIMKVTQMTNRDVWKYVPLQDFTSDSDIDWSKSIHEIDLQLYKKYKLTESEVDFIEKNVKEMK